MSIDLSGVLDDDGAQRLLPEARDFRFDGVEIGVSIGLNRRARLVASGGVAQEEDDFDRAARRDFQLRAHSGARVEPRADLVGKRRRAGQRGGVRQCAVAADELAAITRQLRLRAAHVGESDA